MSARAALVCHRSTQTGHIAVEWTWWNSIKEARQAEAELTLCGPLCIGVHSVVNLAGAPDPRRRTSRTGTMAERADHRDEAGR